MCLIVDVRRRGAKIRFGRVMFPELTNLKKLNKSKNHDKFLEWY